MDAVSLIPAANPWLPTMVPILEVRRDLPDTVTMRLPAPDPEAGFPFAPGQFNMLYVFGVGEVPISISGDPASPGEIIHTTRALGAVTRPMCQLRPGDLIGVRGPYGTGWPLDLAKGKDLVIVAGGLGLAPLRPVVYHALQHRGDYRQLALLAGFRNPEGILFRQELESWRSHLDFDVEVIVGKADPDWHGHVGAVPSLISCTTFDPAETVVMICGPEVMMRFTARDFLARGVPAERIFLSMERNMHCAIAMCGHCQFGPTFVCRDGPVFSYARIGDMLNVREL